MLGDLAKQLLSGLVGGGLGSLAGKGVDLAEKVLVERVLKEVEQHARPYLGPGDKVSLAGTLRLAHLAACIVVLEARARRDDAEAAMQRGWLPDGFVNEARVRLHRRLAQPGEFPGETDAALIAALDESADATLAHPARAAAARQPAEDAAWADLRSILDGLDVPAGMQALFRGEETDAVGWYAGFLAFFHHHLSKAPAAQTAFITTRLATLRNGSRHGAKLLDGLARQLDRIESAQEREARSPRNVMRRRWPGNAGSNA